MALREHVGDSPGFGVRSVFAGLCGSLYLLRRTTTGTAESSAETNKQQIVVQSKATESWHPHAGGR